MAEFEPVGKREPVEILAIPKDPEGRVMLETRHSRDGACRHCSGVEICEDTRTVECKGCGATLDPVDALLLMARHWDKYRFQRDRLKRDVERLSRQVEDLKREERNAKARLRRRR